MYQLPLRLQEPATARIERVLAETCPKHPSTTLDRRPCEVCAVEKRQINGRYTLVEAPAHPNHWTCDCRACQAEHVRVMAVGATPVTSPWVTKAAEASLPYKSFR